MADHTVPRPVTRGRATAEAAPRPVTHGRATAEAAVQDRHRLAMVEVATPRAAADITVAEEEVVVVVIPVVEAEATPAADIVDITKLKACKLM